MRASENVNELGEFLKAARARVTPQSAGIRVGSRRRAPGLRREEVAMAAGISVTWYTWIEQGRQSGCSSETLSRIADALRMSRIEREHLFALTGADERATRAPSLTREASASLVALADAISPNPAYLINGRWDVLHFNDASAATLGPFERGSRTTGNVLTRLFLDPDWTTRFQDWEATAESAVAQFRAATARWKNDDATVSLIAALSDESPAFRAMWSKKQLASSPLKDKVFRHPSAGLLTLGYSSMWPESAPEDVRLIVYLPRGSAGGKIQKLLLRAQRLA